MRIIPALFLLLFSSGICTGQDTVDNRCPYKGEQIPSNRLNKYVEDFTITTTDGIIRNLYNTLDSGKTVFIDLFYTTCSYCQLYAPIIEEVYQNSGAGQEDIEFWGISNNLFDPDSVIDQYRQNYNITNPCAGPEGGGTTAHTTVISGQNFQGWPTYCVICPDRYMYFDACYPPTLTCFNPYFQVCASVTGMEDENTMDRANRVSISPNPAKDILNLNIFSDKPCTAIVELLNLIGAKVLSKSIALIPGYNALQISLENFPEGSYFILTDQPDQVPYVQKVIILK